MPQDRESGARAREFGYHMAQRIAQALGATLINPRRSNEAVLGGRRILIKSAHYGVSIGATEASLGRVEAIIAALQDRDGGYTLYEVATAWFQHNMRPSTSPVMMVRCRDVREAARTIGRLD